MSRDYNYGSYYEDLHDAEWDDYYDAHEEQEYYDSLNCGWHGDDHCDLAGTEHCDFSCPYRDEFAAWTPPSLVQRLKRKAYDKLRLYWLTRLRRRLRSWLAKCPDCQQRFHKHNDDCLPF